MKLSQSLRRKPRQKASADRQQSVILSFVSAVRSVSSRGSTRKLQSDQEFAQGVQTKHIPRLVSIGKQRSHLHLQRFRLTAAVCSFALIGGVATPGSAAERLTLRFGPLEQSVAVADLEHFAQTGELSPALRLYSPLLTQDVRQILSRRLEVDPNVGDRVVEDLLRSTAGERLLKSLEVAVPGSSVEQLQAALTLAIRQADNLSLISILRAYPTENVTIDVSQAIALAAQFNVPYWQSQALSSVLERELTVESAVFRASFDPAEPGHNWVRQRTLNFHDRQRSRVIPVDLYWSHDARGPLVIISHGFAADRRFLAYLATHLASHGLVVAALEHPGSNIAQLTNTPLSPVITTGLGRLLPATEFVDRPRDISFVLDRLEDLDRYPGSLHGKLNTNQVSVIGHSLGGYTALALAGAELDLRDLRQFCQNRSPIGLSPADWLQCAATDLPDRPVNLRDERVAQVIALNPLIGRLFGSHGMSQVETPTLILAGTDDAITPAVSQQLLPFTQLREDKYLLTAIGGTHLSIGDPANLNRALTESTLVRERRGEDTENLRQVLRGVSLAFIQQLTPESRNYEVFLSPAYAQSLSRPDLALRFNTELPLSLTRWLGFVSLSMDRAIPAILPKRELLQPRDAIACNSRLGCFFQRITLAASNLTGDLFSFTNQARRPPEKS